MRIGFNPHRDLPMEKTPFFHQVIIPVYIPNFDGYFSDSFINFRNCVASLLGTCHGKTFISIVDNGSHEDVRAYIDGLLAEGSIHEVIHTANIGKINAVVKGIAGHDIGLVTIADADVMFLSGWQKATIDIFNHFPKAGVVGLIPQFKTFAVNCDNLIFDRFFSRTLRFSEIPDQDGLARFYRSIGWDTLHPLHAKTTLACASRGMLALVGGGHVAATYRRDIFDGMQMQFGFLLGGRTEIYIDSLCLKKDYWRLTTLHNFAYHLGNVHEPWMDDMTFEKAEADGMELTVPARRRMNPLAFFIKNRVFRKIFRYKRTKRFFYRLKGMPAEMIGKY